MYWSNLLCVLALFTTITARDPPTVTIDQGTLIGKEVSKQRIQKIIGYYGIPYAHPPLGKLRFAPPLTKNLPSWEVRNATEYAPACLQTIDDFKKSELQFYQHLFNLTFDNLDEDCLYLNVFVPYGNIPPDGFAVIIWFHPGNFTTGVPSIWDPHTLVYRQKIIMVTLSWRINIMGFFTTMDGEAPGNYGLMDQQAAMLWVKKNIKHFGGNPNNICLMGYGTGAISIGLHMINPDSKGLFDKAIAMSGNFLHPNAIKYPSEDKALLDKLAYSFGCNRRPTSNFIACLRDGDPKLLVQATSNINWRPLIDAELSNITAPFLPELPKNYFERGEFHKVPFLTGFTNMEQILEIEELNNLTNVSNEYLQQFLTELLSGDIPATNNSDSSCVSNYDLINDAVLFVYGPSNPIKDVTAFRKVIADFITEKDYAAPTFLLANYISKFMPTYMYRFDVKPSTASVTSNIPEWVKVPHLFDLTYVWGLPYWNTDQKWEVRDKIISDTIMSFWTTFAKNSNPTENSIYPIKWDGFSQDNPGILIIDGTFNMSNPTNMNYKIFEFWNYYYPKVVDIATQCCNVLDSGSLTTVPSYSLIIVIVSWLLL